MAIQPVFVCSHSIGRCAVALYEHRKWQIIAAIAPHAHSHAVFFEPLVRQPFLELVLVKGPGILLAIVQESRLPIAIELIVQFARDELPILQAHAVILLAALPAKDQRQKDALAISRHKLLTLQRQVSLWFERSIDGIAFADKLVQAERKRR